MKTFLCLFFALLTSVHSFAQDAEMADVMRSNGKIYVLVGIMLIILAGLFGYLFLLERKVKSLEKKIEDNQ